MNFPEKDLSKLSPPWREVWRLREAKAGAEEMIEALVRAGNPTDYEAALMHEWAEAEKAGEGAE